MLTAALVKAAQPRDRAYKLFDAGGLYLFVAPSGLRSWRMKFRFRGKEKLLTIGAWPELSLTDARARRDAARAQIRAGVDPSADRRAALADDDAVTHFESVARAWHDHKRGGWSDQHAADVLDSLERYVFPAIGAMPIGDIGSPAVLKLLRAVEARGCLETARRIRQRVSAVFAFAMSEGTVQQDPAAIVGRALRPAGLKQQHPALLELDDARELLAAADAAIAAPIIKLASRFLALTAVRLAAVRGATWGEFEDLDGAAPLWRVPAARMKLAAAKKADSKFAHLVPLSAEAVAVLRAAAAENGYDTRSAPAAGLVFPGRGKGAPVGEAAIGALYARAGYRGRHVPHGWRATFSTIMNERAPQERAAIDLALAHAPKDKVEAAYNRSTLISARRSLFERWGSLLAA